MSAPLDDAEVFPLPATPLERLMLCDDRPGYPMTARVELALSGRVERELLARSFDAATARHPLFSARVAGSGGWTRWVAGAPARLGEAAPASTPIDLRSEPGLRATLRPTGDGAEATLDVHHAVSDGGGVFSFLEDWFGAYDNLATGRDACAGLRPLAPSRLGERGLFTPLSSNFKERLDRLGFGLREAFKFGVRAPAPIASAGAVEAARRDESQQAVEHVPCTIRAPLLQRLRKAAAMHDATVNDLLIRDSLVHVAAWNRLHGAARDGDWLRLLMPCDLREPRHQQVPAANIMGYSFLTRRQRDCLDADRLLDGIRAETAFIRDGRASLYFVRGLEAATWIPGGLAASTGGSRCWATLLVSNLGDPTRLFSPVVRRCGGKIVVGDATVERLAAFPPLRPKTRVGIVAIAYAGELTLGLSLDRRGLSDAARREFAEGYLRRLEATAGG